LIAPPHYRCETITLKKNEGLALLEEALKEVERVIKIKGGSFKVSNKPQIIGDSAKIHPVLVVFSLLLGESLFAITGALLAVPCLAIVQAVFMHFRESVLGLRETEPPSERPMKDTGATSASDVQPDATAGPVL
jgi:hypothetical protein